MSDIATSTLPISVRSCGKTFPGGTVALEPTELDVAAGETLVLLGPSGCGKTTMLRIIAGLETPDAGGRVLFGDRDVTPLPIEKRNVGMVFQSYALFPNMNVRDNIAYGLKVRGAPKAERDQASDEALALCHITDLADRAIDQLSGGQRQRVALARALAARPSVLLLDEPLTALDASLRDHLRTEIDALLRRLGITAIYVTHDQSEAMTIADRIVVMRKGAIAQIGAPRDIYFQPSDRFVAEFVGTMNRLKGSVSGGLFTGPAGRLAVDVHDRDEAELLFRPEAARIIKPDPSKGLVLRVERAHFLGDRQRLVLTPGDGTSIQIETDNRTTYEPGDDVGLLIDSADLSLF